LLNYKVLPLFVILVLMVLPVSNVYGVNAFHFSATQQTVDSTIFAIGNNEFRTTPTGTVGTDNGHFIAYTIRDAQFDTSIFFTSSTDGVSYTTPLNVTSTLDGFGYQVLNLSIFEDSGIVDMLWIEEDGGGGSPADIKQVRSTNGGTSFGSVNTVVSTTTGFGNAVTSWYQVSGNTISVIYENGDNGDLFFIKSVNGGANWGSPVTVEDGTGGGTSPNGSFRNVDFKTNSATTLYWLMYTATDSTNFDFDVYTQYSNDSGATWTSPINVSEVQGTSAGTAFQNHLFVSGTNVTAIFSGFGGGGEFYLSLARSLNNGVTFNAQQDIELGIVCNWASVLSSHVVTQVDGGSTFHAICRGDGNVGMQTAKTTDSGATWSLFKPIGLNPVANVATPIIVKASGDLVTYVWDNISADRDQFLSSEDGGATFNEEQDFLSDNTASLLNMVHSGFNVFVAGIQSTNLLAWFESLAPPDVTPPVVTLVGDNPQFVQLGGVYNEAGATCLDDIDGQIDGNVVISDGNGAINVNIADDYIRNYDCDDSSTNSAITVQRTVTVTPDVTPPTITLLGSNPSTVILTGTYLEAGILGIDDVDGDISGNVVIGGSVDTNTRGTYLLTYNLQDSATNSATEIIRTVVVQKQSQGTSSGTTDGFVAGGTTSVPTLESTSIPTITPQPTSIPTLSFQEMIDGDGEGFSLADFFTNLFAERIDPTTGETIQPSSLADQIGQSVSGTSQPSTTGTPSGGLGFINAIQDFFSNLFG